MIPDLKTWLKSAKPDEVVTEIQRLRFYLRVAFEAQAEAIITNPEKYPGSSQK